MHKVSSRYDGLMEHYQNPQPKSPFNNVFFWVLIVLLFVTVIFFPRKVHSQDTCINKYQDYKAILRPPTIQYLTNYPTSTVPGQGSLFIIESGRNVFSNLNITQTSPGIAFQTAYKTEVLWRLYLNSITVNGGDNFIWSSMGGTAAYIDSIVIRNCNVHTASNCVAAWSPQAPTKTLSVYDSRFIANISHAFYISDNIPIVMKHVRVDSLTVGTQSTTALSLRHYNAATIPGSGKTVNHYTDVSYVSPLPSNSGTGRWQLSGYNYIDSGSDMSIYYDPLYESRASIYVNAKNSTISGSIRGELRNCNSLKKDAKGSYIPLNLMDTAIVINTPINTLILDGGNYYFENCDIFQIFGAKNGKGGPLKATFVNCRIGSTALMPKDAAGNPAADFELYATAVPKATFTGTSMPKINSY